jgi:Flp pilus assembly pilin Flp
MNRLNAHLTTRYLNTQSALETRLADRRGVSMLEYVLIAGIVLVLAGVLSVLFRGPVTNLISRITDFVNSQN